MTLSPSKTRIESTSCLDLDMNPDQCVNLQRCVTLFGVRSVRTSRTFENHITRTQVPLSKSALPTTPTNVRLTDFVIEFTSGDGGNFTSGDGGKFTVVEEEKDHTVVDHKKDRDFMIHCKDAAVQIYDLDLCFSELHMKSFDNVHHVKVSNLEIRNIVSVKSLEISADTHESTRHITIDTSDANLMWLPNRFKDFAYVVFDHLITL